MGQPAFGGPQPYPGAPVGAPSEQEELNVLKAQADYFQNSLEEIKKRISELETSPEDKTEK